MSYRTWQGAATGGISATLTFSSDTTYTEDWPVVNLGVRWDGCSVVVVVCCSLYSSVVLPGSMVVVTIR